MDDPCNGDRALCRLNCANGIQVRRYVQARGGDSVAHHELFAAGHSLGAQFRILKARIPDKESRVIIGETPGWRAFNWRVSREVERRERKLLLGLLNREDSFVGLHFRDVGESQFERIERLAV